MKKYLYLCLCVWGIISTANGQMTKDEMIESITRDFVNYEQDSLSPYFPIASFNEIAAKQAKKTIRITKENIVAALEEAKNYAHCVITVGIHTIAVVSDPDRTTTSGAWGTQIPYGVGYISKGTLERREDYLNNIIGIPDNQERTMYLF